MNKYFSKKDIQAECQWLTPEILATQEAVDGGSRANPEQIVCKTPSPR
jgi:hypothetical protein